MFADQLEEAIGSHIVRVLQENEYKVGEFRTIKVITSTTKAGAMRKAYRVAKRISEVDRAMYHVVTEGSVTFVYVPRSERTAQHHGWT